MPTTSNYNIAYPGSGDSMSQGAETIRQGIERVDELFGGGGVHVITNTGQGSDTGWGMAGLTQRAYIDGPRRWIYLQVRRAGPSVTPTANGGIGDIPMVIFPDARLQPMWVTPFALEYVSNGATYGGSGALWPSGSCVLSSINPGTEVTQNQNVGGLSVRAWISFIKI